MEGGVEAEARRRGRARKGKGKVAWLEGSIVGGMGLWLVLLILCGKFVKGKVHEPRGWYLDLICKSRA